MCERISLFFFKVDRFQGNDSVLIPWERRMQEVRLHDCLIMNSCQGYSKNNSGGNNTGDLQDIQLGNIFIR